MKVEEFADIAFSAKWMPSFGYGCAVFMQSDIVNFQRQGWRSEEILAGLADMLPKNVFLYVASIPNLASLGTRFVLQGGTQNNLAVVKAEVAARLTAAGQPPKVLSASVVMGVERATSLFESAYDEHAHRLAKLAAR